MERKAALDRVCGLRIRVNISEGADFCGLILQSGTIFPSIIRKVNKVIAHRFRTYEHFTEYQQSLRDWVDNIESYGAEAVVGMNTNLYGSVYDTMYMLYDAIKYVSHLNRKQYEMYFAQKEDPASIPVMHRDLDRIVMTL